MKKLKLPDIAPYSGKRVQPFDGVKRYMSTGDLKGDNLNFEDVTYESKPSRADILVSEGDILFAKMTNTNKALQIDNELDGIIVSTGFSVHRPIENELFGEYFLHFLKHNSFQRQKNKLCTGAIQSAISNSGIEKIFVPVPDYKEQILVANLLSKAENLISQRKESIRLLDDFLKSTFLEMFGDAVKNEKKWNKLELKNYAKVRIGPFGSLLHREDYVQNGIPIVNPSHIGEGKISIDPELTISKDKMKELSAYMMNKGDVVLGRRGEIGRCAVVTNKEDGYLCGTGSIFIRPTEKLNPIFLYNIISSASMRKVLENSAKGITMKNLNSGIIENLKIPVPPIEIQTQFAQIVEKTEVLKTQYKQSLQELENLYGSLSQRAFRGELKEKLLSI
ncbi:restriction endonuclease subunit S [Aquiflexum sp. LQ15W]|uniref:restriction endonuclease subunit S n=1 Tax=Cognataquiflexum nitidum TaxID=2922272 RepID=UPI001F12BA14|nr:restriction endonuclease subunit S [Cognataquiflexum nitidum]MCH6201316.1 restriction endonuclease subunit S [Cognataquiflexum nitidum]